MALLVCILSPVLHCLGAVQDALADLPSREAVVAMLIHWHDRVRHLEESRPFYEHRRAAYLAALEEARRNRDVWDKVNDVTSRYCPMWKRYRSLQELRERGYLR